MGGITYGAKSDSGSVTDVVNRLFANVTISCLNGVPQNITNFAVSSGNDQLQSITGLSSGSMQSAELGGIRSALVGLMKNTFANNVRAQLNQAILALKAASA